MNANREIIDAIRTIAGTAGQDHINIEDMTVVSVDEQTRTCICSSVNGDAGVTNMEVRLMACVDDGELRIPAVDSAVVVCYSLRNAPFILMYSAIDKVVKIVGNSGYSIVNDKLQLNDGQMGGLVKVEPSVAALNALQNDLNNLKSILNAWSPAPNDGGAALKLALASYMTNTLTVTQQSDIENTNITHGSSL
jgi:hypothetical protein